MIVVDGSIVPSTVSAAVPEVVPAVVSGILVVVASVGTVVVDVGVVDLGAVDVASRLVHADDTSTTTAITGSSCCRLRNIAENCTHTATTCPVSFSSAKFAHLPHSQPKRWPFLPNCAGLETELRGLRAPTIGVTR